MNQSHESVKENILQEMSVAIAAGDQDAAYALLDLTRHIAYSDDRADVLNHLLVMPGHQLHQELSRDIQRLRSPSSVPYIRHMLQDDFRMLEYTCSEPGVIAKWFSHALADIDTPESISVIREFANSGEPEVAEEMAYRLQRLGA